MSGTEASGATGEAGRSSRQHVEEVLAVLNAHDAERVASFYSDDGVVHDPSEAGPLRGRAAVRKGTEEMLAAMPDLRVQLDDVVVDGATAALRAVVEGTHTGPLVLQGGTVPATGRRVRFPMAVFSRLDEHGLIVEEHRCFDVAGMAQQLGLT